MNDNIINEAKRIEEDALYSFKGHFNAAARWDKVYLWVGCIIAGSSVIAGSIVFSETIRFWDLIAASMALGSGILAAILTFLEPQKKANSFRKAGADYKYLRDRARVLYDVKAKSDVSTEELISKLEVLQKDSHKLSGDSPVIPKWAYHASRKGIKGGEASYD
ncbi:MAG: SLATT domain-containing protein [Gammaproteobacteria bacterium]|jgi:hypothetical protein|nr:SLATT domain-containing protein [Gammaproteobacteria bacterium]MBT6552137.1 SLATT domain-containing protein [Gammaproteobacteria bacterium]MBT6837546.1 SLATT domain-containing protein [Bacteroidota bacterium]MBT7206004.1 SLATT domain-containing protein [Gammaproteobacteria bacterium]